MKKSLRESLRDWDKKEFKDNSNTYELEMLYESVKNTLSAQQKNDLSRFVRKADTAEEINTYMAGMVAKDQANEDLQEDIYEDTFNNLKKLAYELDEYIEDKVWVRDFWFDGQFENTISFEIYGDWKHDHARFDYYAKEWLDNRGLDYKISEQMTDDDDSDSYGAIHTIRIYNLKGNLEEDISSNSIKRTKYAADAFTIVLNNLSDKLDGYEEFGDGEFDISYQGNKRELQREIIDTFAKADIELKQEHDALVYSIPNNYDAYIYITKDDEASTYTKNSVGYYVRVETVL